MVGAWFVLRATPTEFVPHQDQSRINVRLQTAVGSDIEETDKLLKRAESYVMSRPEVLRSFLVIGSFMGGSTNGGLMFITLKPPDQRMSQLQFMGLLRRELNAYPGLKATIQDLSQSGFSRQPGRFVPGRAVACAGPTGTSWSRSPRTCARS